MAFDIHSLVDSSIGVREQIIVIFSIFLFCSFFGSIYDEWREEATQINLYKTFLNNKKDKI
jgi:hypothetical protein